MDRAYTIKEIDDLRGLCEQKYLFGSYIPVIGPDGITSGTYRESDKVVAVEEMLRTLMMAGITAKQIRAEHAANVGTHENHVGTHEK